MTGQLYLYDTTLRDGSQRKGISLTVGDKLKILTMLDQFGFPYIEGGWPGSNPKDREFFAAVKGMVLQNSKLVAFGSTRRKNSKAEDDVNLQAIIESGTPAVALVGKTWQLHVEKVLETSLHENLSMIADSVRLLVGLNREVIYDAEHFFDGFKANREYALETIAAAATAGAKWVVLCDTNGGSLPEDIAAAVKDAKSSLSSAGLDVSLGIHTHNDSELAVANSLAGVAAGCTQIQGTVNGYGERCGNANLISLIPTLLLKMRASCVGIDDISKLTQLSRAISEIVNLPPDSQTAYVGSSAFAHKGGIHVAAVERCQHSYEHIDPQVVGNQREIVVSELSGRGNIRLMSEDRLESSTEVLLLDKIKTLEHRGYQFEQAEASFKLMVRRSSQGYIPPFQLNEALVVSDKRAGITGQVQSIVKLDIGGERVHTASEGLGPVHALDGALRKALLPYYPGLRELRLVDYKVRILDPESATAAITRVTIEAACGKRRWTTVGCSVNIIEASLEALSDSIEYFISEEAIAEDQLAAGLK